MSAHETEVDTVAILVKNGIPQADTERMPPERRAVIAKAMVRVEVKRISGIDLPRP
ncbi:MAG: hypothetical protein JOZ17_27035 [Acetobacteraceae bacterium]|nr:hypothetical protein [Acetobacteraceae bacterium]